MSRGLARLLAVALVLFACAQGGARFQRYQDPGEKALVYVYRPRAFIAAGLRFELYANGHPMFMVGSRRK